MEDEKEPATEDAKEPAAADVNKPAVADGSESTPATATEPAAADGDGEPINPWRIAELCCWFVVVLAPILTWVNGPSVSTDQFVVRTFVFCAALTGGIVLSTTNFIRWRRKKTA